MLLSAACCDPLPAVLFSLLLHHELLLLIRYAAALQADALTTALDMLFPACMLATMSREKAICQWLAQTYFQQCCYQQKLHICSTAAARYAGS